MMTMLTRRMAQRPFNTSASDGSRGSRPDMSPSCAAASLRSAARSLAERARGLRASLVGVGDDRALGEHAEARLRRVCARGVTRAGARVAAPGEKGFNDAVFQRMERDRHQAAAGFEDCLGCGEAGDEFAQLVIDENAQRLERARRRMNIVRPHAHRGGNDVGERRRGRDRRLRARLTMARATARECRSSPRRKMMLARSRSLAWATTSAALAAPRPHAHVERAVVAEGKTAAAAVSSCMEETPRSSTTPSTAAKPCSRATASRLEKRSSSKRQAALRDSASSSPSASALLVAVDADHAVSAAARIARA